MLPHSGKGHDKDNDEASQSTQVRAIPFKNKGGWVGELFGRPSPWILISGVPLPPHPPEL